MQHLETRFRDANVPFDHNGNRVRCSGIVIIVVPNAEHKVIRCFPHVINLAVQAIYATLKKKSNSDIQYLLGNLPEPMEEALRTMPLPDGITVKEYCAILAADVIGTTRRLVTACRASGQ